MAEKVRYTIDLTSELNDLVDRLARESGIPKSEVFRRALALLNVVQSANSKGEHVGIGKEGQDSLKTEFVLIGSGSPNPDARSS